LGPVTAPACPLLNDEQIRHALDDGACVYYRAPGSGRLLPVDHGYVRDSLAGKSRQRINLTQNAEGDLIFAGFEDRE
jgi:hypothetical protein